MHQCALPLVASRARQSLAIAFSLEAVSRRADSGEVRASLRLAHLEERHEYGLDGLALVHDGLRAHFQAPHVLGVDAVPLQEPLDDREAGAWATQGEGEEKAVL